MRHPDVTAPQARSMARLGGALYPIIIVLGVAGEAVVRGNIVAPAAVATAAKLKELEWLWRLGVVFELVILSCSIGLAVILYTLLKRVHLQLAQAAILFNLACLIVEAVAAVSLSITLNPLGRGASLSVFSPEQLAVLASLSIKAHSAGFAIALVFFGIECVLLGILIRRADFMPRLIGTLMVIGGVAYVINSLAVIVSPPLSSVLFPAILLPALVAELSLALWLLVKGVRENRWLPSPVPTIP